MPNQYTAEVLIYTTPWCPYCVQAKALLKRKGAAFREVDVQGDPVMREKLREVTGSRTVPQIFIDNWNVGGCDELHSLERRQRLDPLLRRETTPDAPRG